MRGGDPAGRAGGRASGPGGDRGPRGLLGPVRRLPAARPGHGAGSARGRPDAGSQLAPRDHRAGRGEWAAR